MRKLKFRAWHKKLHRMSDLLNEISFDTSFGGMVPHMISFDVFNGNFDTECWHKDDFILMQFTGLLDTNGVEIYEGDIVKWGDEVFETVFYNTITAAFETETSCIDSSAMVVVGNIHQNPELLDTNQD